MTASTTRQPIMPTTAASPLIPQPDALQPHSPEQQYRAGAYALLAALLRDVPGAEILERTTGLSDANRSNNNPDSNSNDDELAASMTLLGQAAQQADPAAVDDEYHTLFIGLGRGEIVPYASWYLTGFLMEKPLGQLRADLAVLGVERDPTVKEPEDHVAALCEVMTLLIQDGSAISTQSTFFTTHLSKWLDSFFNDLSQAESATFYQAVARFGAAFIAFERQYYGLEIQESI